MRAVVVQHVPIEGPYAIADALRRHDVTIDVRLAGAEIGWGPVRLLPDFDNILLGHADRTRILPPGKHLGMFSSNGVMQGSVLVDGFVRAVVSSAR